MRRSALLSTLLVSLAACGDSGRSGESNTSSTPTAGSITAASASSGAATDAPTTTASDSSATDTAATDPSTTGPATTNTPKFDLGGDPQTTADSSTGPADDGCTKVDFLFVIDNSASMEDNQAALVASFPGFIDAIQATLAAGSDFHLLVADSDDDGRCKQPCNKADANVMKYCAQAKYEACDAQLTACDLTRGAGVIHPVGLFASNTTCPIAGGRRYMLPDQPDLQGTFACVATVGTAGNPSERPMNGMTAALDPAQNAPGGCNDGFLRDDAILVITFISDDPNFEDEGTPQEWYDAVVAAKGGNKDAVVVAGLIPQPDMGCAGGGNINGAHWKEFIALWGDHGIDGSVCEADYSPFFEKAVGVIADTCDNFMPPI